MAKKKNNETIAEMQPDVVTEEVVAEDLDKVLDKEDID